MSAPHRFSPCISIDFEEETFNEIISKAKDWALMHGIGLKILLLYNSFIIELDIYIYVYIYIFIYIFNL